ncbi:response regulator [Larkinella bovis]|uniref:Response regulator n=1 Tax=Larkinella bovis TaxID=683041 RepID=A0ABW0IE19_9BACT
MEDDEDDQFLLKHSFQQLDIPNPIRFFANGETALEYLHTTSEQPFLILCDINMPRLNGIELRRQINASAYLRKKAVPFVFLTTSANPEMVREAYDERVQGFYQKAATITRLQQQLKQIIEYWQGCLHPNSFD